LPRNVYRQPVLAISTREIATGARLCARIPFTISVSYLRGKQIAPRSRVRVTAASYRISLSPRASRTHRLRFTVRRFVSNARVDRPSPILPGPPLLTFPLDNFPPPLSSPPVVNHRAAYRVIIIRDSWRHYYPRAREVADRRLNNSPAVLTVMGAAVSNVSPLIYRFFFFSRKKLPPLSRSPSLSV